MKKRCDKGKKTSDDFPEAHSTIEEINALAQQLLESILTHPECYETIRHTGRFGTIRDFTTPEKKGARYTFDNEFLTFLKY